MTTHHNGLTDLQRLETRLNLIDENGITAVELRCSTAEGESAAHQETADDKKSFHGRCIRRTVSCGGSACGIFREDGLFPWNLAIGSPLQIWRARGQRKYGRAGIRFSLQAFNRGAPLSGLDDRTAAASGGTVAENTPFSRCRLTSLRLASPTEYHLRNDKGEQHPDDYCARMNRGFHLVRERDSIEDEYERDTVASDNPFLVNCNVPADGKNKG